MISRDYCALRSGNLEREQQREEQRLEELSAACARLTAAIERVSLLLERQEARLDRMEKRDLFALLSGKNGRLLLRFTAVFLLVLLSAAVGINIFQVMKEVLG